MKALVVGGDSKIGRVLVDRLLARGHWVMKTTRRENSDAPLRRGEVVAHLDLLQPEFKFPADCLGGTVYLMAAITGVVPAEEHPDAWRVNAEAPLALAIRAYQWWGMFPVFMSSGTVERAQHTASARQKSYVEPFILMFGGCVLRPLPVVPPERYCEVADLLVDIGEQHRSGVVRWTG